jgi:hypothetical protein
MWAVGGAISGALIQSWDILEYWENGHAPPWAWWVWVGIGVVTGSTLELYALFHPELGDTLSEQIWNLERGGRSLVVFLCLWAAWVVASGSTWPSFGVMFFIWAAYHFTRDAPRGWDKKSSMKG